MTNENNNKNKQKQPHVQEAHKVKELVKQEVKKEEKKVSKKEAKKIAAELAVVNSMANGKDVGSVGRLSGNDLKKLADVLRGEPRDSRNILLSACDAWQLSLLRHLHNAREFVLPSPSFCGLGFTSSGDVSTFICPNFDTSSGLLRPNGTVFNSGGFTAIPRDETPFITSHNGTRTDALGLQRARQLSYFTVQGVVNSTVTITGSKGMWIWADPMDMRYPVRFSSGDLDKAYWLGDLPSLAAIADPASPYAPALGGNGVCGGLSWTIDPYAAYATNYMCSGVRQIYPTDTTPSTSEAANGKLSIPDVVATGFLAFPISSHLQVSVENNTSFTQTGMRVRSCGDSEYRLLNRVEDTVSGYYGLDKPFVRANSAEAVWSGDSWGFPTRCPSVASVAADGSYTFVTNPPEDQPGSASFAIGNWTSVQRMLSQDYPVIEITESSPANQDYSVTLSVSLSVKVGISFLGLDSSAGARGTSTTVPFSIPDWYCVSRSHGRIFPTDDSRVMGNAKAMKMTDARVRARKALPMVTVSHPAVAEAQQQKSSSGLGGFFDKIEEAVERGVGAIKKVGEGFPAVVETLGSIAGTLFA